METRMQGSMRTNLGLLKNLVGADNLKNVVLTTTRWDLVEKGVGEKREKELIGTPEFWGDMIKKGSTTYRYNKTKNAARSLIAQFVESRHPVLLALQDQMVNSKMTLDQTPVGQSFVEIERGPYEKRLKETQTLLAVAIGQKDKQRQKELEMIEKQHQKQLDNLKKEHQRLKADIELLWKAKYAKLEQQVEDLRNLSPSPAPSDRRKASVDAGKTSPKLLKPTEAKVQQAQPSKFGPNIPTKLSSKTKTPPSPNIPTKLTSKTASLPSVPRISFSAPAATEPSKPNQKSSPAPANANSKPPSPRPKSPLSAKEAKYIRSKPENHLKKSGFRASFNLPFYSLEGPNKNFSNLPCKLKKDYRIALGANGHWVAFEPGKTDSEILTSPGFANEYLGLITRFNRSSIENSGALLDLSLGPNRHYWAEFEKQSKWITSNDKFSSLMNMTDKVPDLVAFGAENTFVIKWKNGKVDYNLPDDKYPRLNRKHLANNKDSGELKMVALDSDGSSFITVTSEQSKYRVDTLSDPQRFEIEEWLSLNAGINWTNLSRKLDSGELVPNWVK